MKGETFLVVLSICSILAAGSALVVALRILSFVETRTDNTQRRGRYANTDKEDTSTFTARRSPDRESKSGLQEKARSCRSIDDIARDADRDITRKLQLPNQTPRERLQRFAALLQGTETWLPYDVYGIDGCMKLENYPRAIRTALEIESVRMEKALISLLQERVQIAEGAKAFYRTRQSKIKRLDEKLRELEPDIGSTMRSDTESSSRRWA